MRSTRWIRPVCTATLAAASIALLAGFAGPPLLADEDKGLTGSVELLYRSVSTDGSANKYDEDFDALDSGGRLGNLTVHWFDDSSQAMDYARLEASGLGGDPSERTSLRLGRKDLYELSIRRWKQDYVYDLFELVPDEDGASWNSERQQSNVSLRVFPSDTVKLFFQLSDTQRSGDSLFMKDISRDVFRFESPLDQQSKRYVVGGQFEIGVVDLIVKQTMRRYDNNFVNETEGDFGLDNPNTELAFYDWDQRENGSADLTTLKLSAPLGSRVALSVGVHGTFFGEETLSSRVRVEQLGQDFTGAGFGGTCSVSGGACGSNADCAGGAGDTCVANIGTSAADLDGDHTLLDADLSVRLAKPLSLHLQYRSLDRDLDGRLDRDLDGDGVPEDEDGDGVAGTDTRFDYEFTSTTALVDYRPSSKVGLRVGMRLIDRELIRDGYGPTRDRDYDSGDDETAILGFWTKPTDWFRLNADYEDGDITQPFNAVAPQISERTRVRASFLPQDGMRVDLAWLDFDRRNTAPDLRSPGDFWDGSGKGTTTSLNFWHKANDDVAYTLRYAEQEIDTSVGITFDTAGFGGVEDGDSVFSNENTQLSGRVDLGGEGPWRGWLGYLAVESDGSNLVLGDTSGLVNDQPIAQEFDQLDLGASYTFDSGILLGLSYRDFDYDDVNDLIDYDGSIFTLRAGFSF